MTNYRGSPKHKSRPAFGAKGTLCPEWTHETFDGGLGTDTAALRWGPTRAADLFSRAVEDQATGRRYATERGIAFEAKDSNDGTWHGFPVAWEDVPHRIKDRWLAERKVEKRDLKRRYDRADVHWALRTDEH